MNDETDTALSGATDNVNPTENDNAPEWDYFDPDEQDTEETQAPDATDEAAPEEVETEEPAQEAPALVKLPDGTEASLEEVTKGYLRQADYTRKSQELAQTRKAVETDLQRIEGITNAFIDHLSSMVPAQPDPALALRDPNAYVRQKAQYDAAIAQVQKLIEVGSQPKQIMDGMNSQQRQERLAEENRRLSERFPETATPEGRSKFFNAAAAAANELGFSTDELGGVTDHRLFVLAHWAKVGMDAAKARQTAKAKVAAAPTAPRKPGAPVQVARNADAMKRLARSGSIKDALKVDWD